MGFTKPQKELRRQLLALMKERGEIRFSHRQNRHAVLCQLLGVDTTKTQIERAIGKLFSVGAIRATHPIIHVAGVATRIHVLRFVKDVEL